MLEQNETELVKILNDYIKLSVPYQCQNCGKISKMIGETRINGNWWCPFCAAFYSYKDSNIPVEIPFIKLTSQLDHDVESAQIKPLGVNATVEFPMNLNTGFLVPSFSYKIRRKRNVLLAQAIDFTRYGRMKSGAIWQYDLVFNNREISEFEVLISFADTQGFHIPFIYRDPLRGSTHNCYFDSEVEGDPSSFNEINFSVRISE